MCLYCSANETCNLMLESLEGGDMYEYDIKPFLNSIQTFVKISDAMMGLQLGKNLYITTLVFNNWQI